MALKIKNFIDITREGDAIYRLLPGLHIRYRLHFYSEVGTYSIMNVETSKTGMINLQLRDLDDNSIVYVKNIPERSLLNAEVEQKEPPANTVRVDGPGMDS